MSLIRCVNLHKTYVEQAEKSAKPIETSVLKGLNLTIEQGEQVAILGQSGSGKSTLLHLLGLLDDVEPQQLYMDEQDVASLSESQRAVFRNNNMGFIYQFHHLLMEFTAIENVAMPLIISGVEKSQAYEQARELINKVGLSERGEHLPSQLSGGERQRVAIARALINKPKLVLADEPTGNLDKVNAEHIFDLFLELNRSLNTTLIVVTHDTALASRFERIVKLDNGQLIEG